MWGSAPQTGGGQGSGVAELNLAICYLHGEGGLPYDYPKANELLARAEKRGVKRAAEIIADNQARRKKKLAQRVYAASSAILAYRAICLSSLSFAGRFIQREDSKGIIRAAPSSTAFCITSSSLSPFGYAI